MMSGYKIQHIRPVSLLILFHWTISLKQGNSYEETYMSLKNRVHCLNALLVNYKGPSLVHMSGSLELLKDYQAKGFLQCPNWQDRKM